MKNLWGDLPTPESLRLPVTILKEQAAALSELTNGVLTGDVSTNRKSDQFTLYLIIQAPALEGYTYTAAVASHNMQGYPVVVRPGWDYGSKAEITCNDADEMEGALAQILSSQKLKAVIQALLAQSKAME